MRCFVVFGVTLRLLVINLSSSSPTINSAAYYQRCVITCETVAVVHRWPCLQHLTCCSVNTGSKARYRLKIAISVYLTCIRRPRQGGSHRNIGMPFGMGKLEWCGSPMVNKFRRYVYSFWQTDERDRHTHRHDDIGRACIASRGKNRRATDHTTIRWWVHWPLMGGLLYLVQRGAWTGCGYAQSLPRCTKCNSPPISGQSTNFILFDVALYCLWILKG